MDQIPEEFVLKAEEINVRISPFYVQLYLQYDSDGPDEWRMKLYSPSGEELVPYIVPAKADPHTMNLMVSALKAWGKIQFDAGKEHAVNKIANHFKAIV